MTRHSTFIIYLLQLILYCLISGVCTQDGVKNVMVNVLKAKCQVDDGNICNKKYLQICYNNKKMDGCDGKNANCLPRPDYDTDHTDLLAAIGKNYNYSNFIEIEDMKQIIVKITYTRETKRSSDATACEHDESNRTLTKQGFKVVTTSADGSYQFELLIENLCKTPNLSYCGNTCKFCESTTAVSTNLYTTSDIRSKKTTSMTFSTLNIISRSTSTVQRDRTTTSFKTDLNGSFPTSFKTDPNKSAPTSSLSPIATSEESSTHSSYYTSTNTINFKKFDNSSHPSQLLTVIIAVVCSIVVLLVVVMTIYICYRKHNRKSRTTPSEDDKNQLVKDYIEGEDRHSNTDISIGGHNNKVNLHIENESCDKMAFVTTETDENVNKRDDDNGTTSSKQNDANDISSEIVNTELEDDELKNIVTEAADETEQSNNRVDTVSSVQNYTDDPCTHQHKKNKKKKKKRSDAEEDKPSISADLTNSKFTADENNEIAIESNNGYLPDDEHSDAGLSSENEKRDKIKSDEIEMSPPVDNKENNDQEIESKSKSNSQNDDITFGKSIENEDLSTNNGVPKNGVMTNLEDVSENNIPSSDNGDVPNQAQTNGDFQNREILRKEMEVKVDTIIHEMSEMKRDITEHTNNSIDQVKEEVSVLKQDITEQMFQHKNEIKEQIKRNKKDMEKTERKQQKKIQKLKDQIEECTERLTIFEDRIKEYANNQELLEKKVEASGGKHDAGRREIIETENEIQKLRDEMNRLSENLRQQISQQKRVIGVPDNPLFTKTPPVSERSPHSNDLLRSRTASDDALYRKHSDSIAASDQHSELEKKRKKKKKKRTPSIRIPGDGTVHIQHEENTIDIEQIGPMEVQQTNRGIRLTGGNVEIDIKSPRKKTSSPQKDHST